MNQWRMSLVCLNEGKREKRRGAKKRKVGFRGPEKEKLVSLMAACFENIFKVPLKHPCF